MKRSLKVGLISGIVATVIAGSIVAALAKTEKRYLSVLHDEGLWVASAVED